MSETDATQPVHPNERLTLVLEELTRIKSVGIFLPEMCGRDKITDVTILSNMITKTEIDGRKWFACNWKQWMNEHEDCSPENIIAFAEEQAANGNGEDGLMWRNLVVYSSRL